MCNLYSVSGGIREVTAMSGFDDRVMSLCDQLWAAGARKHAACLYLAAFTGFGTERAYEMLNALREVRADRHTVESLGLSPSLAALIAHLQNVSDKPHGSTRFEGNER